MSVEKQSFAALAAFVAPCDWLTVAALSAYWLVKTKQEHAQHVIMWGQTDKIVGVKRQDEENLLSVVTALTAQSSKHRFFYLQPTNPIFFTVSLENTDFFPSGFKSPIFFTPAFKTPIFFPSAFKTPAFFPSAFKTPIFWLPSTPSQTLIQFPIFGRRFHFTFFFISNCSFL